MIILRTSLIVGIAACFGVNSAVIEKNGYRDVAIGFSENVKKIAVNFEKLKEILRNASEVLFQATRRRSYFEEFVLVVPPTWADSPLCEDTRQTGPPKIDIYIADTPNIPQLRAINSKGCGQVGDIIHMTVDSLKGNVDDLTLQFIQQWSTYRYGVFPENPESAGSCTTSSDNTWSPTGCYNVKIDVEPQFYEDGLPRCYFPEGFDERDDLHSSLMFQTNSTKAVSFCDGSTKFPHNSINPTLHNRICGGQTAWSVIKNGEDFKYGRNLEVKENKPLKKVAFRCFKQSKTQVTLSLQTSSAEILSVEMTEIRYALTHFLTTMGSADSTVNLVTFADVAYDEVKALELLNIDELSTLLDKRVKQTEQFRNICIVCGLSKAYEVAMVDSTQYSSQVIVFFLWESSLETTKSSDVVELIQRYPDVVLFMLLVEDTGSDVVPSTIEDAIESTGGQIFRLRTNLIFMVKDFNTALIEAFEKNLHIENKAIIVHEKLYENVTSDNIHDVFSTPKVVKGKLLYTMHCQSPGLIRNVNNTCSVWDTESQTYKCGKEADILNSKDSLTVWKYYYERSDYIRPVNCISLAWLKVESPSHSSFTVRGWLSDRKITPGRDTLIIYAEVIGIKDWNVQVDARISGPGLEDFTLELRDNGNGDPDIVKEDGIFSRYFTAFADKGTYRVTIHARCTGRKNLANTIDKPIEDENTLSQVKSIGTFRLTDPKPEEDIMPPNRVADLMVLSIDHQNKTVLLQWTAPGDDYDYGKATEYKIYFSHDWRDLQDQLLNKIKIKQFNTSKIVPNISGSKEKEVFQFPNYSEPVSYYIALSAADDNENEGMLSNVLQAFINHKDPETDNLKVNDTRNETEITKNNFTQKYCKDVKECIIIAGSSLCAIFLLILVNILVCTVCLRKYKKVHRATKLKEYESQIKMTQGGQDINSDEMILRSEYKDTDQEAERDVTEISVNQHFSCEHINKATAYAKIQRKDKTQNILKISHNNKDLEIPRIPSEKEKDLGLV